MLEFSFTRMELNLTTPHVICKNNNRNFTFTNRKWWICISSKHDGGEFCLFLSHILNRKRHFPSRDKKKPFSPASVILYKKKMDTRDRNSAYSIPNSIGRMSAFLCKNYMYRNVFLRSSVNPITIWNHASKAARRNIFSYRHTDKHHIVYILWGSWWLMALHKIFFSRVISLNPQKMESLNENMVSRCLDIWHNFVTRI